MTIQIDIAGENPLAELVEQVKAGEEVLLTEHGETFAIVRKSAPAVKRPKRVPGAWAHLGTFQDPDLFLRPDPELEELAESRDEDHFYR
jgi:antitoxin (DNA-binding transcriptional repressor) of toxin-antitoxin stability system